MSESNAPPSAPPESFVAQQFRGLRNTITAERLAPDELRVAINVDLDDAGQARRRRGYTLAAAGNYHSLFKAKTSVFVVKNDALGVIYPNYSFTSLRAGVGAEKLSYVQVGGDVFFSSSLTSGVIHEDLEVGAWGAVSAAGTWLSPVINPTDTLSAVGGKLLGKPPMATALAYHNGRIYLASGRDVWATELYFYHYVDKTRTFMRFESEVTMLGEVTDGLYVGTATDVWFLSGRLAEMRRVRAMAEGAVPGSMVYAAAELIDTMIPNKPQGDSKNSILFMTGNGLCVGLDGGMVYNITQERMIFPDAVSVASMFRSQDGVNQYVGVADSGGSPSSAARLGDYVDAEIRRFQGA